MSSVCDCPYCGQPTAIPENLDSDTVVRCPLCEFESPGDQALMYAVEAPPEHVLELPPALIRLRTTGDGPAPPAEISQPDSPAGSSEQTAESGPPPADDQVAGEASAAAEDAQGRAGSDTPAPEGLSNTPAPEEAVGAA